MVNAGFLKKGTQIIRVPDHAAGNHAHPDCERGFVTSVRKYVGVAFCRYWRKDLSDLRTKASSEGTPMENLELLNSVPQSRVRATLAIIDAEIAS